MEGGQRTGLARPETPPRAAHVPVRQVVDETGEQRTGLLGVEVVEGGGDVADQFVGGRDQPAVEDVPVGDGGTEAPGSHPEARAYSDWKATVFQ